MGLVQTSLAHMLDLKQMIIRLRSRVWPRSWMYLHIGWLICPWSQLDCQTNQLLLIRPSWDPYMKKLIQPRSSLADIWKNSRSYTWIKSRSSLDPYGHEKGAVNPPSINLYLLLHVLVQTRSRRDKLLHQCTGLGSFPDYWPGSLYWSLGRVQSAQFSGPVKGQTFICT